MANQSVELTISDIAGADFPTLLNLLQDYKTSIDSLRTYITSDLKDIKGDIASMQTNMAKMKTDIAKIEKSLNGNLKHS